MLLEEKMGLFGLDGMLMALGMWLVMEAWIIRFEPF